MVDWFYIIYLFSVSKNGLSAKEIERQLGVTYKCAWRIANRVRYLFDVTGSPLKNIVEIDETYQGGRGGHNKRGLAAENKTPIFGMIERGGAIKAKVVINTKRKRVMPLIRKHVEIGTEVMTDKNQIYRILREEGYRHKSVNHHREEWVRGKVHVNTLEGFWSQLKRSLNGTHHMVSPKYLQSYVNEFSYRYNHRLVPRPLFLSLVDKVARKV